MTASTEAEIPEAQIAVHWQEEPLINPPPGFAAQANVKDSSIFERFSEKNFPQCFEEYANMLNCDRRWDTVLDASNPPFWKWFVGGKLNAAYNCVDRHVPKHGSKAALIWVPEPEDEVTQAISYRELYHRVN